MTTSALAKSYLQKARARLRMLDVLMEDEAYSDVVREAQEIVELALKAMLRQVGIEPPKYHDVGPLLTENVDRFPVRIRNVIAELAGISAGLRKERELSFYGDIDFIPTEQYTSADGSRAVQQAGLVVETAGDLIMT